jgi:hypothetical protein
MSHIPSSPRSPAAFSPRRSRLSLGPSLRPRLCLSPSRSSPSSAVRLPRRLVRSLLLLSLPACALPESDGAFPLPGCSDLHGVALLSTLTVLQLAAECVVPRASSGAPAPSISEARQSCTDGTCGRPSYPTGRHIGWPAALGLCTSTTLFAGASYTGP